MRRSPPRAADFVSRPFPPWGLLWAFLGQVLDPDKSCARALARIQAHRAELGLPPLSPSTGGYCKARARLPEGLFARLARRLGGSVSAEARPEDLWRGRRVKVVDGSSAQVPDTPGNRRAFGLPPGVREGCGFPVVAFVGVFCLATGALLDLAMRPWPVHDLTLFALLRNAFAPGEIWLADRAFCTYAELALTLSRGVDAVVRLHQRRSADFRRGRAVGALDRIVVWSRPLRCPPGLSEADFARLPERLSVRQLRYRVETKGFRSEAVVLATTLLSAEDYPAEAIAALYLRRWEVEIDFRHIKTTMKMELLSTKSPAMVRKEIWAHLLAYNLVRAVMLRAAAVGDSPPTRLSFKGAIQTTSAHALVRGVSLGAMLDLVAAQIVPHRPERFEPRVRKRRPKNYRLMTRPRWELKARIGA